MHILTCTLQSTWLGTESRHVAINVDYLLRLCLLAISGWVLYITYNSLHSWRCYNAAPVADQTFNMMTYCPTWSHYPGIELISPCHILIMPSTWLGSDKYAYLSHGFDWTRISRQGLKSHNLHKMGSVFSIGVTIQSCPFNIEANIAISNWISLFCQVQSVLNRTSIFSLTILYPCPILLHHEKRSLKSLYH